MIVKTMQDSRRPMKRTSHAHMFTWCAILLLVASGCEEDVAGPIGVDEPYSVYGIINPRLETQTLLVSTIEQALYPFDSALDAVVTSTDLATGERVTWEDSLAANETGQLDHVFTADFRPDFGSRHRVEVTRSDGGVAAVEVRVPLRIDIDQEDTGTRNFYVDILGEDISILRLDVIYTVRGYSVGAEEEIGFPFISPRSDYSFPMKGKEVKVDEGWRLRINLDIHYETMRSYYFLDHGISFGSPACGGLGLFGLEVSMTIGGKDWNFPGGEADPNALSHPGTLRNVENGFGFVGGGYNEDRSLFPSTESLDDTFFFDFIGGRVPHIPPPLCGRG